MNRIIFDVEIAKTVEQAGGWDATDKMGIGVAVVWQQNRDRFTLFDESGLPQLRELLLAADEICGFNIWSFDLPVIFGVPRANWEGTGAASWLAGKTYDLFRLLRLGLKAGLSGPMRKGFDLDSVATSTLAALAGKGKTAHGSEAPGMFQRGELVRLHNYCLEDVRLERDAILFAKRYGYIIGALSQIVPVCRGRELCPVSQQDAALSDPLWNWRTPIEGDGVREVPPKEPMPQNVGDIAIKS